MSVALLEVPTSTTPQTVLNLKSQAPDFLKSQSSWSLPWPLNLFVNSESQEKWQIYENMFLACIRAGDDETASAILKKLIDRFGVENERCLALRGLYKEATAKNQQELDKVMAQYEELLKQDPSVFSIRKRRAALLRSMGKTSDAITAMTGLLDTTPTDPEAWSELSDLYLSQGALDQSVYCLEEVLLLTPNAWNMHAKLAEVLYLSASKAEGDEAQLKLLSESMRRFCRSLELCDNYLRGFYGLKLTTNQLLQSLPTAKPSDVAIGGLSLPSTPSVKKLNELATSKLAEILRRSSTGETGWDGYSEAELAAARALLDRDTQKIER